MRFLRDGNGGVAVPEKKFDSVATRPLKAETCPRRILLRHLLCRRGEQGDPVPHVGHAAGEIDPHTGAGSNHASSSTGSDDDNFRLRPSESLISITGTVLPTVGLAATWLVDVIESGAYNEL